MMYVHTKRQRGVMAIETALLFPLLILILFGMIEFGLLIYNRQVLTNACREGARFGIVQDAPRRTAEEIEDEVEEYCEGYLVTFGSARRFNQRNGGRSPCMGLPPAVQLSAMISRSG